MLIAIAAVAGLITGQLFHLFFDRFYTGTDLRAPVHPCAACQAEFRVRFAVPLVGWLQALGRCPDCGARLSLRGILLPAGACALFVVSALVFDSVGGALLGGFFATVFLALTLTDLETRLLPNRIVYPAVLLAIAFCWAWPGNTVTQMLAGGAVAIVIASLLLALSIPFGANAFGMGDVKMIILIGFVVGMPSFLVGIFLGTLIAGAVTGLLVISRLRGTRDYIPHGPFLAAGAVIALFWGQAIWDAYRG